MNILFVCSRLDTMVSKRGFLISSLVDEGNDVSLISMERHSETEKKLRDMGVDFYCVENSRNKVSVFSDIKFLLRLFFLLRVGGFDRVLSYTIKPNVYSGLAVFFTRSALCFFPFVTGLGYAFQGGGWRRNLLRKITVFLHRFSFSRATKVVFQNENNMSLFVDLGIVPGRNAVLIMGDGVEIDGVKNAYSDRLDGDFVCVARLLGEKGLRELHAAIVEVKKSDPDFSVKLYGPMESSPDAISEQEVKQWAVCGTILWKGYSDDVKGVLKEAACFVLPSYHEGMSTAVAEAMAEGVPVIGTDISGIRELVDGNGFLVAPKNYPDLAQAIHKFISLSDDKKIEMSEVGISRADMLCNRRVIMNRIKELVLEKQ